MNKQILIAITSAMTLGYNTIYFDDGRAAFVNADGSVVADYIKTEAPNLPYFFENSDYDVDDVAGMAVSKSFNGLPVVRNGSLIPEEDGPKDLTRTQLLALLEPSEEKCENGCGDKPINGVLASLTKKLRDAGIDVEVVQVGGDSGAPSISSIMASVAQAAQKFSEGEKQQDPEAIRIEQVREDVLIILDKYLETRDTLTKALEAQLKQERDLAYGALEQTLDAYGVDKRELLSILGGVAFSKLKSLIG